MPNLEISHRILRGLALACLLTLVAPVGWAATFTVNSTADAVDANPGDGVCATAGGQCTLRAAVMEGNAFPGPDVINVPPGTYTLTIPGTGEDSGATGDLDITEDLTITGAGAARTIIDGGKLDRVFDVVFPRPITVNISGVTIQNGVAGSGGGIRNLSGTLALRNCIISGNEATTGGGINNFVGTVTITNSTVSHNTAVYQGGGINSTSGTLDLEGSTVRGNKVDVAGGGIYSLGNLTIISSTISGNTATWGGGIHAGGTATITASTITSNSVTDSGGGIRSSADLKIADSTVSSNFATRGAGIEVYFSSTATLTNSTLTDNGADSGGNIISDGTVELLNTIVANSPSGGNCAGSGIGSLGHNLDSGATCGFTGPGNLVNTDPMLGFLEDNGGPTYTHALLPGSPAIDAGNNEGCPATDQRGIGRPIDGNADGTPVCDIGAYEAPSAEQFTLSAIRPSTGGDTGTVSVILHGSGFKGGATVKLVSGGSEIVGNPVSVAADGRTIAATFDLTGKTHGLWDVVVTSPDGTSATLAQSFTIEEGRAAQLWVDIVGPTRLREGRPQRYFIRYGNDGNNDTYDILLLVEVPRKMDFIIGETLPLLPGVEWSQIPRGIDDGSKIVVPIWIYRVPPGMPSQVSIEVTAQVGLWLPHEAFTVRAELRQSDSEFARTGDLAKLDSSPTFTVFRDSLWQAVSAQGGISVRAFRNPQTQVGAKQATETISHEEFNESIKKSVVNFFKHALIGTIAGVATVGLWAAAADGIVPSWVASAATVAVAADAFYGGYKDLSAILRSAVVGSFETVTSLDPNDKAGPIGSGDHRFVTGQHEFFYALYFENLERASAPAQEVVVTDQLDTANMDLSTFSLGAIAFGDKLLVPTPGSTEYTTNVDLRPAKNLIVKVEGNLNKTTGLLTWRFTSIDPATGLPPEDPLAGFLPPNVNPPEGQGSVLFTVMPKEGLPTGTEIRNQASIVFDVNPPVLTPQWLNTLDNTKPTSQVQPLAPTQTSASFLVEWSGTDEGAGIRDYTIYVSDNGGSFTPWLFQTPDTSATFTGMAGHTYAFYSLARDLTGNMEETKTAGEASTLVVAPEVQLSATSLTFANQLVGSSSPTQSVNLTNPGNVTLTIMRITPSGDFTQENTCGTSLGAGTGCTINVTFRPTAAGSRPGTLSIATDASGSPHTVTLSGTGTDFALAMASGGSASLTVNAGETAGYNLQLQPTGYAGTVSLSCTWPNGQPRGTACTLAPNSVNLDGANASPFTVTVATTRRSLVLPQSVRWPPLGIRLRLLMAWWILATLVAAAFAAAVRARPLGCSRRVRIAGPLVAAAFLVVLTWMACGGGGGGGAPTPPPQTGTPAGTYTLTITGTSSGVPKSTTLTLKVN